MIETLSALWAFIIFSLVVTLISTFIKMAIISFRFSKISEEEFKDFKRFDMGRIMWIASKNSISRIIFNKILYFFPGHALMMNAVFIYYTLMYEGTYGVIKGIIASERLSFVPLIKFKYNDDV